MEYRNLGCTGLKVSALCLGTMTMGWTSSKEDSFAVLDAFVQAGGNFIDTADVYSFWAEGNPGGVAEAWIGEWLAGSGLPRHQLVIATKVRGRMWDGPNGEGLSRVHIVKAVEDSLRRLQTDYIDLYLTHWPDEDTPLDETMHALDHLVRQGKVRYLGASNHPAWLLMKALWVSDRLGLTSYDCLQPHYNLVHRAEFEQELMAVCQDQGLGVTPYSSLEKARGATSRDMQSLMTDHNFILIEKMEEIGRAHEATVAQVAIAWMLNQPVVSAPIIGANMPAQLTETLGGLEVQLTDDEVHALSQLSEWRE